MKSITIERIKMLWKALTDENYMVVSLDDWCENAFKWYNEGIKQGKMAKKTNRSDYHGSRCRNIERGN